METKKNKVELSPIVSVFAIYSKKLDEKNDRYERLVKLSRDITSASKKIIFGLHRPTKNPIEYQKSISTAETNLIPVRQNILKVRDELQNQNYYKYNRAFLWGIQEYCEAVAFLEFFISGKLITKSQIESDIISVENISNENKNNFQNTNNSKKIFEISWEDYILGITDTTGELMRLAISSVGEKKYKKAEEICVFIQRIYNGMMAIPDVCLQTKDFQGKLKIMKGSLEKVEKLCFSLKLREAEYGEITSLPEFDL